MTASRLRIANAETDQAKWLTCVRDVLVELAIVVGDGVFRAKGPRSAARLLAVLLHKLDPEQPALLSEQELNLAKAISGADRLAAVGVLEKVLPQPAHSH